MPSYDAILQWVVRRPGCVAWSTHSTKAEAFRTKNAANINISGHQVYAEHQSGKVTGPYSERNDD